MEELTLQEALNYCLENPEGLSTEQLLDKFPRHREELASLLAFDSRLAASLPTRMSPDRSAAIKQRLMAKAASRGTDQVTPSAPEPQRRRPAWTLPALRPLAWVSLAALVALALLWYSASDALPGSPLYNIRAAGEDARLALTGDPADLARAHLDLANTRLHELRTMQQAGNLAQSEPGLDNYSSHLNSCISIRNGLKREQILDLDLVLYTSTTAGLRTFEGFRSVANLPTGLRSKIEQTIGDLTTVNMTTTQLLQSAGVNPAEVLQSADEKIRLLLTPVPVAAPQPATTPRSTATPKP